MTIFQNIMTGEKLQASKSDSIVSYAFGAREVLSGVWFSVIGKNESRFYSNHQIAKFIKYS